MGGGAAGCGNDEKRVPKSADFHSFTSRLAVWHWVFLQVFYLIHRASLAQAV